MSCQGLRTQGIAGGTPVVQIEDLCRSYGARQVLHQVSFSVQAGEIFGFLGPNGAGKTTTLEILEGLKRPTSGSVRVFGLDVQSHRRAIRQRIGVSLQSTQYWGLLTVRETLQLFRSFYRRALSLDELVASFELEQCLGQAMGTLSGGLYQRVVLALALVNDPELVLLDEPTTGLDPSARRRLWTLVEGLRQRGRTVILTTHYMDEAQALCGRVAILQAGRIVLQGTPAALTGGLSADVAISFQADERLDLDLLRGHPWCVSAQEVERGRYLAYCRNLEAGLAGLMGWASNTRTALRAIETRVPTLDDVFLRVAREPHEVAS